MEVLYGVVDGHGRVTITDALYVNWDTAGTRFPSIRDVFFGVNSDEVVSSTDVTDICLQIGGTFPLSPIAEPEIGDGGRGPGDLVVFGAIDTSAGNVVTNQSGNKVSD
jgi:hypothetical protein